MLKIQIAERFKPFSHVPGIKMPLPYSDWTVEIFPARLTFSSHAAEDTFSIDIPIKASPERFTATCDLERGGIKVEMVVLGVSLRYWLFSKEGIVLYLEKGELPLASDRLTITDSFALPSYFNAERVSFGISKKQDWELIKRRHLITEFVPIWFRLAQTLTEKEKAQVPTEALLKEQFHSCYSGLMVEDAKQPQLMGSSLSNNAPRITASSIRALFFKESDLGTLEILPDLLPCFPEGRFMGLRFSLGTVDLEWAKGRLRKMIIHAEKKGSVQLKFPSKETSYRLRSQAEPTLDFQAGCEYFLDQFLCR